MWVEANFPSMFSLKMMEGNIYALDDPSSVLLSASIAKTLFGNESAMNKTVKFDNKNDFKVAGVYEDLPHNTTLYDMKLLLSWKKYITTEQWLNEWNNHSWQAFVEVNNNINIANESEKIKEASMVHKNAATDGKEEWLLSSLLMFPTN